jgi:hypothetical protein
MRSRLRAAIVALTSTAALVVVGAGNGSAADQVGENVLIMGSSTTACAGQLSDPAFCFVKIVENAHPLDHVDVLGRGGTYIGYGTAAENWTTTPIPSGHDRVVIQLGINDWYVPVAPATLRQQIDRLIIRVKTANPGAKIAWVRTWMPSAGDTSDARKAMWTLQGQYTADAMNYARTACNPNCTPTATFIDMGTSPGPRRSTASGDGGWHYNDLGHKEIGAAVNDWLDRY